MELQPLPDTTLAWLAALIDGEGSIMLNTRREQSERAGVPILRAQITVANTDLRLMKALAEKTGIDRVYEHKRPETMHHKSRSYTWRMNVEEIRRIGPQLLPWLVLKRDRMELLLEALELKLAATPRKGEKLVRTKEYQQRMLAIQAEIQHLNRRGRWSGAEES